jgi:hypothetical protein
LVSSPIERVKLIVVCEDTYNGIGILSNYLILELVGEKNLMWIL